MILLARGDACWLGLRLLSRRRLRTELRRRHAHLDPGPGLGVSGASAAVHSRLGWRARSTAWVWPPAMHRE